MDQTFTTAMRRAMELTRAGDPQEATRVIQQVLSGGASAAAAGPAHAATAKITRASKNIPDAEIVSEGRADGRPAPTPRKRQRLRDTVAALRSRSGPLMTPGTVTAPPVIPAGARYETRSHAGAHGQRDYRLYVPSSLDGAPRGLVLMLHGCTQNPDDFARGTGMNAQAEAQQLILVYPHQSHAHNMQGCWNWFRPADQRADAGEPALLAELVRAVAAEFGVPSGCIFAAGLSAGGAMAAILGTSAPDLFSAVGVHSGLPAGAAHDPVSAFAAMRGDAVSRPVAPRGARVIAFHGTADKTVNPSNGAAAAGLPQGAGGGSSRHTARTGQTRGYDRHIIAAAEGSANSELWTINGMGHAWSGGRADGSYTDPSGPDASAEMVRFFLQGSSSAQ